MGGLKEETKGLSMPIEEMGDKLTEDYHIRMHLTGVVLPPAPGSIQALTIGEHPVVRSNAGSWQQ